MLNKNSVNYKLLCQLSIIILIAVITLMPYVGNASYVIKTDNWYISIDGTKISAHRAGAYIAPENTLRAFKQCIEDSNYEVSILEFDLRLTKDDQLVLLHDDTLDKTSNAREYFNEKKIKVRDKTLAEIRNLNMAEYFVNSEGERPYYGLRGDDIPYDLKILTLTELLEYMIDYPDFNYNIEIKDGNETGMLAMDILYDILVDYGALDKTVVASFHGEILKYIDNNYANITRSASPKEVMSFYWNYLTNKPVSNKNYSVLQVPYKQYGIKFAKKKLIDYAHKNNIAVQFWTINDEEKIKYLINIGADAIITDNPLIAYEIIESLFE